MIVIDHDPDPPLFSSSSSRVFVVVHSLVVSWLAGWLTRAVPSSLQWNCCLAGCLLMDRLLIGWTSCQWTHTPLDLGHHCSGVCLSPPPSERKIPEKEIKWWNRSRFTRQLRARYEQENISFSPLEWKNDNNNNKINNNSQSIVVVFVWFLKIMSKIRSK